MDDEEASFTETNLSWELIVSDLFNWQTISSRHVEEALIQFNRLRISPALSPTLHQFLEAGLDALFQASTHLIVYGSLAPGKSNHDQLSELRGEWKKGWVTGELKLSGWGATRGFPGLRWDPQGVRVPAHLFVSEDLVNHWDRLDEFEGQEYRRILVPIYDQEGILAIGNLYEIAPSSFVI